VINHFVQKLINFFPTEKIPKNKFIKFIFKLIYFLIRNILKGPFVIKTKFFKIYAYPQKQESSSIYYRGFHEYSFLEIINNLYHRDSKIIFLDIGANVGNNTLSVANFYKNISCYSFEPNPKYFSQLNKNIELNDLNNIKTFNYCIGLDNAKSNFYIDLNNPGGSTLNKKNITFHPTLKKPNLKKILIKEESLDGFLKNIDLSKYQNFFIKIDVEGAELRVLQGANNFIKKFFPDILLEIEEKNFMENSIDKKLIELSNIGYSFYKNFKFKINIKEEINDLKSKVEQKKHFHLDFFITKRKNI